MHKPVTIMVAKIRDIPNSVFKKVVYPDHEKEFVESVDFRKQFCDITIICNDQLRIKTHKTLLAVSSVFLKECLLASESSKEPMCFISIPDVNSHDVQMLLKVLTEGYAVASAMNLERLREIMTFLGINLPKKKNNKMSSSTSGAEQEKSSPNKFEPCQTSADPLHIPNTSKNGSFDSPMRTNKIPEEGNIHEVEKLFLPPAPTIANIKQEVTEEEEAEAMNTSESTECSKKAPHLLVEDPLGEKSFEGTDSHSAWDNSSASLSECQQVKETKKKPLTAVHKKSIRHFSVRERTVFEKYFQKSAFATKEVYDILEKKLGLPRRVISDWFSYRRNKYKGCRRKTGVSNQKVLRHSNAELIMKKRMQSVHKIVTEVEILKQCEEVSQSENKIKQTVKHLGGQPPRRAFTKDERIYLERIFKIIPFPARDLYRKLERKLWISRKALYDWFSHRRTKHKRAPGSRKLSNKEAEISANPKRKPVQPTSSTVAGISIALATSSSEEQDSEEEIKEDQEKDTGQTQKEEVPKHKPSTYLSPKQHKLKIDRPAVYNRTVFHPHEKEHMEKIYHKTQFPQSDIITELEQKFKVSRRALTDWFGHRRRRDKVIKKKKTENKIARMITSKYKKNLISKKEKEYLEKAYNEEKFPTTYDRRQIARGIGISEYAVSRWFIQRRSNDIAGIFKENKQSGATRRQRHSLSTQSSQQSGSVNEDIKEQKQEEGDEENVDNV